MEEQLKALSSELKVTEYVEFLGYVPHEELPFHYLTSDVFALPSKNEGMSNTILEAMASGLPIITTDTGGTAELIDGNGIIVPVNSPQSLKNAILDYVKSLEMMKEHGIKSREVVEGMNWCIVAENYYNVYQEIL
jgi:glycosyltransferase involved in cell wall biosynthesis